MNCNEIYSFVLRNSLAAVSAVLSEDRIFAADGINRCIYTYGTDGAFQCSTETVRPYRRLRKDISEGYFTALGCCEQSRIYILDRNFNELGYTTLDRSQGCGCGNISQPTDAMSVFVGDERFFTGAFAKNVYLFGADGNRMTELCSADCNEIITDFITFGNERFALSALNNGVRTVTISDGGSLQTAVLDRRYTLRMLFAEEETVYGLFGQNYLYNRIIPIYASGKLTLPRRINFFAAHNDIL